MTNQWFITTKGEYINLSKYTDVWIGKTSANQYVIYAQDYQSDEKSRELPLGVYNNKEDAVFALSAFMKQRFDK